MSDEQIAAAESEGMIPINYKDIQLTVEHTDPGANHKELMEMLGGIFIQVSRMYDTLLLLIDKDEMEELDKEHSTGGLLASPPILREDAWDE